MVPGQNRLRNLRAGQADQCIAAFAATLARNAPGTVNGDMITHGPRLIPEIISRNDPYLPGRHSPGMSAPCSERNEGAHHSGATHDPEPIWLHARARLSYMGSLPK